MYLVVPTGAHAPSTMVTSVKHRPRRPLPLPFRSSPLEGDEPKTVTVEDDYRTVEEN
jgi:hypothetical protein